MTTRLYLVRHGRASAGWGDDLDPGLDDVGRAQAAAAAAALAPSGPLPIVVSPLRRTRETASAFEHVWGVEAVVDPAVGEIPSPTDGLTARQSWLVGVLAGCWGDVAAGDPLHGWRDGVVGALLALPTDTVVVTHYVAINVAVGAATTDDRFVCFHPDNGSITVLHSDGERLHVGELGAERHTVVR